MLIKAGVDISRLNRQIRRALSKVDKVFKELDEDMVITSTYEGNHSGSSLHYANDAFDVRYPDPMIEKVFPLIMVSLGKGYDVVREVNHIHIEYDPKG